MPHSQFQYIAQPPREIFRAYDIRSVTGPLFNPDIVYTIALAIGSEAQEQGQKSIIIGCDGRLSSPTLGAALKAGLLESGCDVFDIGLVPTPLVYFATYHLPIPNGVMLTGSHNPGDHNGLKMQIAHRTLTEDQVAALYDRICQQRIIRGKGKLTEVADIFTPYIKDIQQRLSLKKKLKIAVDCGNGVPGLIAPKLYRALGCEVIELFTEVDGHFPNHHPDPAVPENMQFLIKTVLEQGLDVGIAFDGDGDRLGVVTNNGEMINPDRQMILFVEEVLKRHPGASIVYDIKSTYLLGRAIKQLGGVPKMWKSGHSLIKKKMLLENAPFAGEFSGHFFFKDNWFGFDDGIYAGARLLSMLANMDGDATELFKRIPNSVTTSEITIPIDEAEKFDFVQQFIKQAHFSNATLITIDGVRAEFPYGWGLLRASNTTPMLTTRFEADDQQHLKLIQEQFKAAILAIKPNLAVPF